MANPSTPTVPEIRYESITGEQLAVDVAELSGMSVEQMRNDGVQASLVALHLTEGIPEDRHDLIRLATGEPFVRPTAFHQVTGGLGMILQLIHRWQEISRSMRRWAFCLPQ